MGKCAPVKGQPAESCNAHLYYVFKNGTKDHKEYKNDCAAMSNLFSTQCQSNTCISAHDQWNGTGKCGSQTCDDALNQVMNGGTLTCDNSSFWQEAHNPCGNAQCRSEKQLIVLV